MSVFGVFFGKVEHAPETKHENDKTICPANYQVMIVYEMSLFEFMCRKVHNCSTLAKNTECCPTNFIKSCQALRQQS